MGLRQRKKENTHSRILDAARQLFRENGYEQTRMESVATKADISVGTVYNYFDTKHDLLLAIIVRYDAHVITETEALFNNLPANPVEGIVQVFAIGARHSFAELGRANWRQFFAASILHHSSPLGASYGALNTGLSERVVRMLEAQKRAGHLAVFCDSQKIGDLIYKIESTLFITLTVSDSMPFEAYEDQLRCDIGYLLQSFGVLETVE